MPRASKRLARYRERRAPADGLDSTPVDGFEWMPPVDGLASMPGDDPNSLYCPVCGVDVPREEWYEVEWVGVGPPPTELFGHTESCDRERGPVRRKGG